MKKEDLEKSLWNIANAITAFAIAQGVVFAYKFSDMGFREHFVAIIAQVFALMLSISNGIILTWCICRLRKGMTELSNERHDIEATIHIARVIAIWGFSVAFPMICLFVPKLHHLIQGKGWT